jgi:type IV pilus assembly protein PilM
LPFDISSLKAVFNPRLRPLIGLDISSTTVRMLELVDAGGGEPRVERYAIEPLPKDAVIDGDMAGLEAITETIQRCWKRLGTSTRNVAMAVPTSAVITKKIILPAGLREQDMMVQVESEANQYLPFALEEVNLDFQVIGPAPTSAEEVEVLLAASRKEKVEDRVALAEAAGLKALVMDVESYATLSAYERMASLLPNGGAGLTVAICDIGANSIHINILNDNESVYLREHGFGGNQLNYEISRRYGMTTEEAETAKRKGTLPETYEMEVLRPYSETLAMEIGRALQLFTSSTQYHKVDHVLLAGGGAIIPGLDEVVSARVNAPSIIANPFSSMSVGTKIRPQQLANDAPALFVACGLAMRRFDQQ